MKRIISLNTIIILSLVVLFCFLPGFSPNAHAATLIVLNNNDSGPGSLRQTIADAGSGDEIVFDPGLAGVTIALTSGQLTIDTNLAITGPDAGLTISGNHVARVLYIGAGLDVIISNLTITEGRVEGNSGGTNATGGGIYSLGNLTLQTCTVSSNTAAGNDSVGIGVHAYGGGIFNEGGALTLENCNVSNNLAKGGSPMFAICGIAKGGGICNDSGTVTLQNCTVSNNYANAGGADGSADAHGGGIYSNSILKLNHCTVSGNLSKGGMSNNSSGDGYGGGISSLGSMTLEDCTVSGNAAQGGIYGMCASKAYGGGMYNGGSMLAMANCTVSSNYTTGGGGLAGDEDSSGGGGIFNGSSMLTLENCTISGNAANIGDCIGGTGNAGFGGGVYNYAGATLNMTNTVIATSRGGDCYNTGNIGTNITNWIEDNSCSPDFHGDPLLGPLQDNGGPTRTHLPEPESGVIDAGTNNGLATDQRGVCRPVNNACDIGSVEWGLTPQAPAAITENASGISTTTARLNGRASFSTTTELFFEYGIDRSYGTTIAVGNSSACGTGDTAFSRVINGLKPGTTYHFRAFAINSEGTSYGEDMAFRTDVNPIISGSISGNQGGVAGVILSFSNGGGSVTTDSKGNYSHTVTYGWSGTVIPVKYAWIFSPEFRTYNSVNANMTEQNYSAYTISLSLQAVRKTERAWIVSKDYGEITIGVDNPGNITVSKYTLYRKASGGAYSAIHEFSPSDINNTYIDKFFDQGKTYTYKVTASGNDGTVLAVSGEKTI